MRADKFIELVKRHTEFTEFSASLLNEFVEKIIVHEATKVNGAREQEVEIYLNFIGKFDLPEQKEQPEEQLKTFLEQTVLTEHSRRILDGLTARNAATAPAQGAETAAQGNTQPAAKTAQTAQEDGADGGVAQG